MSFCPHAVTIVDGSSYCTLAEEAVYAAERLRAENEAMRPVVEAAERWREVAERRWRVLSGPCPPPLAACSQSERELASALDAYRKAVAE